MNWKQILALRLLQQDFCNRLQKDEILDSPFFQEHTEEMTISSDKTEQLRDFCWEMVRKFRNSHPKKVFINNMTGKLAEEAVKNRLGKLLENVNYQTYSGGDGKVDFRVVYDSQVGLQVKARTVKNNDLEQLTWTVSQAEVEQNKAICCLFTPQSINEAQSSYRFVYAGFLPTSMIKITEKKAIIKLSDLLYSGGLGSYLLNSVSSPNHQEISERASCIEHLEHWISEVDWQQIGIGLEIPPGPQRIRGIAGSGKTILLCLKAAWMHLKYPDWQIGFVFFTRSLYPLVTELIDLWLQYLSGGKTRYSEQSNLKILHAWGEQQSRSNQEPQLGFLSFISKQLNHRFDYRQVANIPSLSGKLAFLCKQLLSRNHHKLDPLFDAILIDEGMDLVADEKQFKFEHKQSIYWLAWQSLHRNQNNPHLRRLIWAYDEAQSLDSLTIPSSAEIFGHQLSQIIGGSGGNMYQGRIQKSYVMRCCYRTPGRILTIAHALGMGWFRKAGMLNGITNKKDWEAIGYKVKGDFRQKNSTITLTRPSVYSPNPIDILWKKDLVTYDLFNNRTREIKALVKKIKNHIYNEGITPCQNILIIVLGHKNLAMNIQQGIAHHLQSERIKFYLPGACRHNQRSFKYPNNDPNGFWYPNAVTISLVPRSKGHEAYLVYILGLDQIARNEADLHLRNQLFVALTRTKAWVELSGLNVKHSSFYKELSHSLSCQNSFTFTNSIPKRKIGDFV